MQIGITSKMVRHLILALLASAGMAAIAQQPTKPAVDPTGTYQYTWGFIAGGLGKNGDLPYGLKNPPINTDTIKSKPWALELEKATIAEDDPAVKCQPTGPFRVMMTSGTYFEMLPSPSEITMLFQIVDQGQVRRIHMDSPHPAKLFPTWNGDSRGHWDGDTLVVDTTGFNDKTWLGGGGIRHSEALHMVERFRWVTGAQGSFVEYTNTVEDPKAFDGTFSYTRIYRKLPPEEEITEYVCNENPLPPLEEVYNPNGLTPKPTYASKRLHPDAEQAATK